MMRSHAVSALLGALAFLLLLQDGNCAGAPRALLHQGKGYGRVTKYVWRVTLSTTARPPDCYIPAKSARPVILVNGEFQPTLTVTQGETISVKVINELPQEYNDIVGGISIHWHGFHLEHGNQWLDGVAYVSQCPIQGRKEFTYTWKIDEAPGTYFWHDHSKTAKADGLRGALIVLPAKGTREPFNYDKDRVMFLTDWFWGSGAQQAVDIQRPFDFNKSTSDSGTWHWIGLPQSILLNGKGIWSDCDLSKDNLGPLGGQAPNETTCSPVDNAVTRKGESCPRAEFQVKPNKTYRFRIINSAALVYMTVCFGGHEVSVVAQDAVPVKPFQTKCVDVNSGQRADVLLKTDQPISSYWITVLPQFRKGSPNGYGVLKYKGSKVARPEGAIIQPGSVKAWDLKFTTSTIRVLDDILQGSPKSKYYGWGSGAKVPKKAHLIFKINSSQPLFESTGQLRWALNNIAHFKTPPCEPIMDIARRDPNWLMRNSVPMSNISNPPSLLSSPQDGARSDYNTGLRFVFLDKAGRKGYNDGKTSVPTKPTPGLHVVEVRKGRVVDVVVQNNPGNSFGGDYRPAGVNRTGQEQHPFHLHGHHFWVVATGEGIYDSSNVTLNDVDPAYRDTVTLFPNSWVQLRFLANNPGVWPLHCHIMPHMLMGQMLYFKVGTPPPPPKYLPECPATCASAFQAKSNVTGPATLIPIVRPDDEMPPNTTTGRRM